MTPLNSTDLYDVRGGSLTPNAWLLLPAVPSDPFLWLLFDTWPQPGSVFGTQAET